MGAYGSTDPEGKSVKLDLGKDGKVIELLVHNYTYNEIVIIVSALSGIKIEASVLPEGLVTYTAKNTTWDGVIWGVFPKDIATLERVSPTQYRVTGIRDARAVGKDIKAPAIAPVSGKSP
jgi:hypothetical protein